jgi:hypothetical protein
MFEHRYGFELIERDFPLNERILRLQKLPAPIRRVLPNLLPYLTLHQLNPRLDQRQQLLLLVLNARLRGLGT